MRRKLPAFGRRSLRRFSKFPGLDLPLARPTKLMPQICFVLNKEPEWPVRLDIGRVSLDLEFHFWFPKGSHMHFGKVSQ